MQTNRDLDQMQKKNKKVAFILSQFPEQYETFLLREIVELKKTDISLYIFSLKKCRDKIIHPEARHFLKETQYSNFIFSVDLMLANIYFLLRNPTKYIKILFYIISKNIASFDFFIKSLILFPISVYYALLIKKKQIDIVHGYWATFPATSAFIISRLIDIPFSFTGHAHDIYVNTTMLIEKMQVASFIATCTAHNKVYLLDFASRYLSKNELDTLKKKTYTNYHGIEVDRFKTIPAKFNPAKKKIRILSVGSLLPCKGFDILIDTCARIKKRNTFPFECVIVGGGPLMRELKAQIMDLGVEQEITITGNLPQDKVIPYYRKADIFALPIRLEIHWGIPNVVIEAAAAHTVVVTGALPSIPELIINDVSGFIIPEEDPEILAEKIELLGKDPELRKKLADNAYSIILEKFNRTKNAQQLALLFKKYTQQQ